MTPSRLNLYPSLDGRSAAGLRSGRDLVLGIDDADGLELPTGVLAIDHVPLAERCRIDELTLTALAEWQGTYHDALTVRNGSVGDLSLPWLWETDLILEAFLPTIRQAVAVRAALRELRPQTLRVSGGDGVMRALLAEVARAAGVALELAGHAAPSAGAAPTPRPVLGRLGTLRRRALDAARLTGIPSHLRSGAILVFGYWPLTPLFDRLLQTPGQRPAFAFSKPPLRPARSLRSAVQGGWLGTPGPAARGRAERRAQAMLAAVGSPPRLDVDGLELGAVLHERALAVARRRAARDLANAEMLLRAFAGGDLRRVVIPTDMEPDMRLVAHIARGCGVPVLLLAHGAFPVRHTLVDMQVADDIALWSETFGPTIHDGKRALHVVGYPHEPAAPRRPRGARRAAPRVLVIGRARETTTAMIDERYLLRHYQAAIEGVRAGCAQAEIVLRPHPAESHDAAPRAAREHRGVRVDVSQPIMRALGDADLCIGTASTATFQAALAGVAVIVLNVTGYTWEPPLDGSGEVPVVSSATHLATVVAAWSTGEPLGGGDELLAALGADPEGRVGESVDRIMAILGAGAH